MQHLMKEASGDKSRDAQLSRFKYDHAHTTCLAFLLLDSLMQFVLRSVEHKREKRSDFRAQLEDRLRVEN